MLETAKRFEANEEDGKNIHHAGIAAHWIVLHSYFHGAPVCTIHRSVSGALITPNGIQK
jgi:hypothetical protein